MKCPVCRAENNEGPECRRCKADLSLMIGLDRQRSNLLHEARRQAQTGDWLAALQNAAAADALHRDTDSARLLAACRLKLGDFDGGLQEFHALRESSSNQ